jgi:hypothetical protein
MQISNLEMEPGSSVDMEDLNPTAKKEILSLGAETSKRNIDYRSQRYPSKRGNLWRSGSGESLVISTLGDVLNRCTTSKLNPLR